MELPASLLMTAYLNALRSGKVSAEVAATAVLDLDVAHHVVDPDGVLTDLDHDRATELREALPVLVAAEPEHWVLTLPLPGAVGSLRGPRPLTEAAVDVGEAVLAGSGGTGLVPYRVGRAVQWRVFVADRPGSPLSPYDAERALSETLLTAASTLTALDVAAGTRPRSLDTLVLPPGYGPRQQSTAERALRLRNACSAALVDDGASISSYEADVRARELRAVRDAASDALCAAATWISAR